MFLGEFQHSLDAKGRVILPAKFRDQLAGGAYITKGRDGCLFVYTAEEFENVANDVQEQAKLNAAGREAARTFAAGTIDITPDKQGRVAIPQNLRDYAGLHQGVTVAGVFSRIEIWDNEKWREREARGDAALSDGEDLQGVGM